MSNVPDRLRPPPGLFRQGVVGLLAVYAISAVALAVAPQYPWPARALPMELRSLLVALPGGLLAVILHVRRRRPELLQTAMRLYLGTFALRFVLILFLISASWAIRPGMVGQPSDDCVLYYRFARTALVILGREDPTWQQDVAPFMVSNDPLIFREPIRFMSHWPWLVVLIGYSWLFGHSALAMTLPLIALSCFFIVQIWLFLHDACSRRTANLAVLWCLLLPDQHVLASGILKDIGTGVGLLYLCEFGASPRVPRPRREWPGFVTLPLFLALWRPEFLWFAPPFMLLLHYRRRLPDARRRQLDRIFVVGAFVGGAVLSRMSEYSEGYGAAPVNTASYYGGVLGGLAFVPAIKISVTAFTRNVYLMGMADLPVALLWPFVMALSAAGLVYGRRLAVRYEGSAGLVIWFWQVMIAATGVAINHKYRTPLDPLIVAFALETIWALQRGQPAVRRKALQVAAWVTAVLFTLQLGVVVMFDIGR